MFTGGADVTPDQFDWYCYQGRAFGIHVDLNSGSFCSGKMLLGSYMKKPLWVDHSATTVGSLSDASLVHVFFFTPPWPSLTSPFSSFTRVLQVFHLVTSSVNVVINGSGSRFRPAQAFVVPCGKNSKPWRTPCSFSLSKLSTQLIVLFTVVCSHRTCLQHPECLGTARRVVLHQDIFRKLRLKTAAWTSWGGGGTQPPYIYFFTLCK